MKTRRCKRTTDMISRLKSKGDSIVKPHDVQNMLQGRKPTKIKKKNCYRPNSTYDMPYLTVIVLAQSISNFHSTYRLGAVRHLVLVGPKHRVDGLLNTERELCAIETTYVDSSRR